MARKTRRASPPAPNTGGVRIGLAVCVATGLVCAALGAGSTYLALRPALAQASISRTISAQTARVQGDQDEDQGQWAQAITSYQQAIAEGIDNPDIRTDLGVAYFKSSQPQKALEQYVIAQRQNPNHENSLFNEASAYAVLGDSSQAINIWHTYLGKFPSGQHVADAKNFIAEVQAHGLTPAPQNARQ
ncbi:MAG: tetratricopeptide repeat protein [Janthinobacterium lividum]